MPPNHTHIDNVRILSTAERTEQEYPSSARTSLVRAGITAFVDPFS